MVIKNSQLIGSKPGGSSPAIAGTRIRVAVIAQVCRRIGEGKAAIDEMLTYYPDLTAEQLQAAIDYWHENEAEIEAELREEDEIMSAHQASQAELLKTTRKR